MTSPKDLPEICGRRLTGGRTAFKASSRRGKGSRLRAETAFLNVGDHWWQDVRPLKTAVQGLQLADGD